MASVGMGCTEQRPTRGGSRSCKADRAEGGRARGDQGAAPSFSIDLWGRRQTSRWRTSSPGWSVRQGGARELMAARRLNNAQNQLVASQNPALNQKANSGDRKWEACQGVRIRKQGNNLPAAGKGPRIRNRTGANTP